MARKKKTQQAEGTPAPPVRYRLLPDGTSLRRLTTPTPRPEVVVDELIVVVDDDPTHDAQEG